MIIVASSYLTKKPLSVSGTSFFSKIKKINKQIKSGPRSEATFGHLVFDKVALRSTFSVFWWYFDIILFPFG